MAWTLSLTCSSSHLFLEYICEVVDDEVVALVQVGAQQDVGLLEVLPLERLGRRVRKEDPVVNGCEGAAHDPEDDPVPLGVDHCSGVDLTQARRHVAHLVLERKHGAASNCQKAN